jgi:hypothetical protein
VLANRRPTNSGVLSKPGYLLSALTATLDARR